MSIASIAPRQFEGRPLSCISGRDEGSDCGQDNWDTSAGSGFYTVCCNGDIIDITGFNSWTNYTLLLKNLVCCPGENPSGRDGSFDETKGCLDGPGRPLSELLATSTEVAQPWTLETAGETSTVNPECFWSLPSPDDEASTTATSTFTSSSSTAVWTFISASSASATSSPTPSLLATTSQSILSSKNLEATSSPTITSPVSSSSSISTTSSAETAQSSTAVSTGLAAAIVLPRWSLPAFLLLSLGLSM